MSSEAWSFTVHALVDEGLSTERISAILEEAQHTVAAALLPEGRILGGAAACHDTDVSDPRITIE